MAVTSMGSAGRKSLHPPALRPPAWPPKTPTSSRFPTSGFVSIHTGNDFELSIGEQDFLSFSQRIGQGRNAFDAAHTRQGQCLIESEVVEVCVDAFHRALEGLGRSVQEFNH